MKRELLLKAFGDIDENYIAEAYRAIPEDASGTSERIVHMNKKRFLTFALAAALILALGITAYGGRVLFGWGGNMEIRSEQTSSGIENTVYVHTENMTQPVSFEDGRMVFVVNDEHIDITDQVSETEPYIYHYADEEGVIHYWIIGKNGPEPEHYGFAEYLQPSDGIWTAGYVARTDNNTAPWLEKAWEILGFDFNTDS
ncbi:MAG: hypothetical protein IJI45_01575 [Anaerolineaceae bacterium]|nr:hypothetical protein [Oscillospiraceae bacterium]MBQ6479784.1 hypothetical protein [Anaerolineaceae bacterium]